MRSISVLIVMASLLLVLSSSCSGGGNKFVGGSFYFTGWKDYRIPFQPYGEITYDEAKKLDAYYIATFDDTGNIVKFQKILHGKVQFTDYYYYNNKGEITRREMRKSDGEIIIDVFDDKGNIIK